jgi:hypothetical protein
MRHLAALFVAITVAPSCWLLLAVGQDRSTREFTAAPATGAFDTTDFLRPVACLAGAGLLLGLLATLRFSPLAAIVTGCGYTAGYLALLVAPTRVLGLFPHSVTVAARSTDAAIPLRTGTALVLGVSLLASTISVGRRRYRPRAEEPAQPATAERSRRQPSGAHRSGPSPSPASAKPRATTRYPDKPWHPGNRRTNSYGPAGNSGERWQQTRQSTWPYR